METERDQGWRDGSLADVLEMLPSGKKLQMGWSPQCLATSRTTGEDWAVLKTTAVQPGEFYPDENKVLPSNLEPRPAIEVKEGDLLLTNAGPRARCGIPCLVRHAPPRLMLSGKIYRFRTDATVMDPRFLEYYLLSESAQQQIDLMKTGISDSGLNLTHARFLGLRLPIPPLDEQRRIVAILEDHLSRLDAANGRLDAVESRTRVLLAAAFESCAKPDEGRGHADQWRSANFGEIATIDSDLRNPSDYPDLPHIAPNHIERDTGRLLAFSTVAEDGVTSPKHAFHSGQILYSKIRPYLNKVARPGFMGLCSADMYPISTSEDVEWLHYMMLSPSFVRKTSGSQNRTVLPKINARALRAIQVMVPPRRLQLELAGNAASIASGVLVLESVIAESRKRSAALRRALLAAAFEGQLTRESISV